MLLDTKYPQKTSRRASRAGMLHFPMVLLLFEPKCPKKIPARFARRNASFPYGFAAFLIQMPKKQPGALRAPECFIFLCFAAFSTPDTPKIPPARFARRIASFPYFCCFLSPNTPKMSRRASRAGLFKEFLKGIRTGLLRH